MTQDKKYSGSCLCKKVSFEFIGDFNGFYLCHCGRCRKVTGSAHGANLFSTSAKLNWLTGEEHIKTFHFPNTRFVKSFCDTCGSALPNTANGRILVPAGSLDCDVDLKPNGHIFIGSKANWDQDLETVTKFENLPNFK